jgi:KDO2-lipid IV(A) lauroyltransferase
MGSRYKTRGIGKMKEARYFIEYSLVRFIEFCFSILPKSVAAFLGRGIGVMCFLFLGSRRRLAKSNLSIAFPEMSESDRSAIVRKAWENIGQTAVEFVRMPRLKNNTLEDDFMVDGRQNLEAALKVNKGVIIATLHLGNWEMLAVGTRLIAGSGTAIARPMKNPYVEAWVQGKRSGAGVPIILHRQAVRASLKILRDNKVIGILLDQNLYTGGVFVDFFGRPAATTTLPALLQDRTGAPIVVSYCYRENGKFKLVYEPPLVFPSDGTPEARILNNTQIISNHLENIVRKHPDKWFWIHNRWKRKQVV